MKLRWMTVGVASMALIVAGVLVRTELRNRRELAKRAAAYRFRAEQCG